MEGVRTGVGFTGQLATEYAERHDGWFPKGEASPEASLSLLHRENPTLVTADVLARPDGFRNLP